MTKELKETLERTNTLLGSIAQHLYHISESLNRLAPMVYKMREVDDP